jgi:hypothetical protein
MENSAIEAAMRNDLRKEPGTQTEWLESMTFHEMSNTVERADRQARDAQYSRKMSRRKLEAQQSG